MKTQKLILAILFSIVSTLATYSQVGIGTTTPDASAILDITSTNKGLLLPRLAAGSITNPATGLIIFNTTTSKVEVNTGTPAAPVWTALGGMYKLNVSALQTGNYTATAEDELIQANINGDGFTVTLPTEGIPVGKVYYITNKGTKDWIIAPGPATQNTTTIQSGIGHTLVWTGTEYVGVTGY